MPAIAGLDEIAVINSFQEQNQQGFLSTVFGGPAAVQISRTIAYAFIALTAITGIGFLIAGLTSLPSSWRKRSRRGIVNKLPKLNSPAQARKRKAIEAIFIEHGVEGLTRARKLLNDEEALKREIRTGRRFYGGTVNARITPQQAEAMRSHIVEVGARSSLSPLISAELLSLKRDELRIDSEVKRLLDDVIERVTGKEDDTIEPPAG